VKFFSQILFVSKSGNTHSTQYQVEIFQALSSIAINIITQLSLSDFQTQTFCHISVQSAEISAQSVLGIIITNISAVYLSLKS
jgi:hypothetical protein